MTPTETLLAALLLIFAAPFLVWRALRLERVAPLVVVQIVGGVLMGPGVLGAVAPGTYGTLLTPSVISTLNGVALWAVMLFVWVAGLELDFRSAWADRREAGVTAGLALGVPLAAGAAAAALLLRRPGWIGPHAAPWQAVLGIGMACAVTALPILVLFLDELKVLRRPFGQRVLRFASLDDVAIWGVLALIIMDWTRVGRQGAFIVGFAVAAMGARALLRRLAGRDRWPVGIVWMAACGLGADWSGLHFMVGAFLAGAVLDAEWFGRDAVDRFRDTVLLALMPVFFLSTGLRTRWSVGGPAVFGAAALLLAAAVGGKLAGVGLAGRVLGWRKGEAWVVGWLLQTKALIMIIFVGVLLDRGIITPATFTALLLMALGSTVLTMPVVRGRIAGLAREAGPATA